MNLLNDYAQLSEKNKIILNLRVLLYYDANLTIFAKCFTLFLTKSSRQDLVKDLGDVENLKKSIEASFKLLKSLKLLNYREYIDDSLAHLLLLEIFNSSEIEDYKESVLEYAKEINYLYFGERIIRNFSDYIEIKMLIYSGESVENDEKYKSLIKKCDVEALEKFFHKWFLEVKLSPIWLQSRSKIAQKLILSNKLKLYYNKGKCKDEIKELIDSYNVRREEEEFKEIADETFLDYDVFNIKFTKFSSYVEKIENKFVSLSKNATVLFFQGSSEEAIKLFDLALKNYRSSTGSRIATLEMQETILHCLAIFNTNNKNLYSFIDKILDKIVFETKYDELVHNMLQNLLLKVRGIDNKYVNENYLKHSDNDLSPFIAAVFYLIKYWLEEKTVDVSIYEEFFNEYKDLHLIAAKIFAELVILADPSNIQAQSFLNQKEFKTIISFVNCVKIGQHWERAIENLDYFFTSGSISESNKEKRLVWHINPEKNIIEVLEQSINSKGVWSRGKTIAIKHFYDSSTGKLDYISNFDKKLINTLIDHKNYYDRWNYNFKWDDHKTPLALIGHPRVFHIENQEINLEFIAGNLELIVKEINEADKKFYHLTLSHYSDFVTSFIEKENIYRYRVIEFAENAIELAKILGKSGIKVPFNAKEAILSLLIKAESSIQVRSEIDDPNIVAQKGDSTPCIQIIPKDLGLEIGIFIRPYTNEGPYVKAGGGYNPLNIFIDGNQIKILRDMDEEKSRINDIINSSEFLLQNRNDRDEWSIEDPEKCLEILSILQSLPKVNLEWPKGNKISVARESSYAHTTLKIKSDREWFGIEGSVQVDDDMVLTFQQLLDLMSTNKGKFIRLTEDKFIALSEQLRRQLEDLNLMGESTKYGFKIHNLGALVLKDFTEGVSFVEGDSSWKNKTKNFQEMDSYHSELPIELKADLRDYQKNGFEWISKLFYGGFGACLADDMGLGKTVQAIAVLINIAKDGPCIVIAPTSVCHNWILEISKFAPHLNCQLLSEGDRNEVVRSLGKNDVLICSYTLLQQEIEILKDKKWQMAVLDEAQYIKNSSTKRFQAAIKLDVMHKLALTGTPIENSLEEIWSLFRFITPGLFGSKEVFQKKFVSYSDSAKDKERRKALKNIVQLFMLRRTKKAVLLELPSRTEKTIFVESTAEELAFYEALRRQALMNISKFDSEKKNKKIHILAEITRLRRACCHPQLASPDISLSSSKLNVFFELVEDLLKNNHQVLVFSQFVNYLVLVRKGLEERGIFYQYLDGSTHISDRKKQVEAFQAGESSVFLLSLKAGGTGLNLTAADYVVHLDPWWNPAIEDQASDRAHRMGQKRPVTIYRLIVKNSIEEKILNLHKSKRDLADELLEGTSNNTKMSEQELLDLLAGNN